MLSAYSIKSGPTAPIINLSWRDKVDHFCVYGLLAVLVFQALPERVQGTKRWLIAFVAVSAFGLWDETLQHFNPARTGDPLDWLADSLGALTAVVICAAFPSAQKWATWNCLTLFPKRVNRN
ncbi:VanZ family protein [Pelagicoccus sp. NFK12]|uniref:VanZ family protein n=1 Tax=Pelagicoccus enzymogenes TaxID=2773457 RepID=A0A927IK94_9BACT|nr:VanZ family protein [Pelagicoccus enzymogenes]MBD5782608.1 VanZ family protein [Pelagicoccus enzymogenes]MDQ8199480.1 VanZ family protein [Pelagicoccus enzymogenes]